MQNTTDPQHDIPVLIVGGGPVGLALAVDLALRDIRSILVERRAPIITVPKMNMVNTRSMEFSRRWGLTEAVRRLGCPMHLPQNVLFCTSLCGYLLARFEYPSYDERGVLPHTPEGSWRISQMEYDPLLIERARALPQVELLHETECTGFTDTGNGVTATLRDVNTGDERRVAASYLVGCDGAESGVRTQIGITMEGPGQLSRNMNLFFSTPDLVAEHDKGFAWANWLVGEQGYWGLIVSVDGRTMWRVSVPLPAGKDTMDNPEALALIDKAIGKKIDVRLHAILPWVRRQLVAREYAKGRVFIAGDAAHVMSPTGGLGMNTGLGDAMDLSWKLAATLHGWGGAQLLASYDAERRPVAEHNVAESGDNFSKLRAIPGGPHIHANTADGDRDRAHIRSVIETPDYEAEYRQEDTVLGYRYSRSPILGPVDPIPPRSDRYEPSDAVGGRAPHLWLQPGISTIDRFWTGPTLVCVGGVDAPAAQAAAKQLGVPWQVLAISPDKADGLYTHTFTLVRPDGHVAWRGNDPNADWATIIGRSVGRSA